MNFNKLKSLIIIISICHLSFGQNNGCELSKSASGEIFIVDKDDILCLAKSSVKEKTLVFTFGIWCAPCIKHLPNAIKLARKYNLDFYILLTDKENSDMELSAIEYFNRLQEAINEKLQGKEKFEIKVINLKDVNGRPNKKYKQFLDDITPPEFENINGMSKFIILNNLGKVIMVTNWKDNRENDWKDNSKMIEKRIEPVLK